MDNKSVAQGARSQQLKWETHRCLLQQISFKANFMINVGQMKFHSWGETPSVFEKLGMNGIVID